jgi:CSLREA domain-containing protein
LEQLEDRVTPAVFNVNSLADIFNPSAGTMTLRSAIQAANNTPGGNTINLTLPGTYQITIPGAGEDTNATGDFDILPSGGNLTIQNTSGGMVVVDGNHLDRIFDINPGNTANPATRMLVTMQGFTIQNGAATDAADPGGPGASGGAIRDQGNASLTLINMVITNNSASADGGGIAMENVHDNVSWILTVNNSTISNNHAGDAGGGIETDGKGTVFINAGSVISGNTAINKGGGICLDRIANAVDTVTISNPGSGYTSAPTVTIRPPPPGGTPATATASIALPGGVVTGVTVTNPGSGYTTAPTVTFSAAPAGGVTATATATMTTTSANLTMTGTLVNGNRSTGTVNGLGGGICNSGNGTVSIIASTVENNFAATTGGGFSDEHSGRGTLNISESVFLNNSAGGNGGGIFMSGPSATITNTLLQGNASGATGGALFEGGTVLTLRSSTIALNTASVAGGGIEFQTTGTCANASTIISTTMTGDSARNSAGGNGGAIDAPASFTGTITLLNDTINGNFATAGGGIFWGGSSRSTFVFQNTIVAQNSAFTGPDANNPAGTFTDTGGNVIGVAGAGSGNTGFTAASTQTGTFTNPLDPLLGALANNGGPIVGAPATTLPLPTEALLRGSPALGKGVLAGSPTTDERGFPRALAGAIDAGALSAAQAAAVTSSNSVTFTAGQAGSFSITTSGFPTASLTETGALPNGVLFHDNGNGTATLSGAPAADSAGTYSFLITASNGGSADAVQAFTVTVLTGQQRFVQALYLDELGRFADLGNPLGAGFWVNALTNGILNQAAVATAVLHSQEARTHLVRAWYQTYLARQPLKGEEQSWVTLLQQEQTEEQVLSGILGSTEFFNRAQILIGSGTPQERYVQALYQLLLNRRGSAGDVAGWVNALPQLGRQAVALRFLSSTELRAILFTLYYNTLLHRAPDQGGLSGWVQSILDATSVRLAIETSAEFFANG